MIIIMIMFLIFVIAFIDNNIVIEKDRLVQNIAWSVGCYTHVYAESNYLQGPKFSNQTKLNIYKSHKLQQFEHLYINVLIYVDI